MVIRSQLTDNFQFHTFRISMAQSQVARALIEAIEIISS